MNLFKAIREISDKWIQQTGIKKKSSKNRPPNQSKLIALLQKELSLKLKKRDSVVKLEIWFLEELFLVQTKNKASSPKKNKKRTKKILYNFPKKKKDSRTVFECFDELRKAYIASDRPKDALRMMRMAAIFADLTPKQLDWAFETAVAAGIDRGYWVSEAGIHYASNGDSKSCRDILENAKVRGNAFSEFILTAKEK